MFIISIGSCSFLVAKVLVYFISPCGSPVLELGVRFLIRWVSSGPQTHVYFLEAGSGNHNGKRELLPSYLSLILEMPPPKCWIPQRV